MESPLIDVAELAAALDGPTPPRVLDVRWTLARPDGSAAFREEHLPGAVYVDLEHELSGHGVPTDGRHPLPDRDRLQDAARGWGLRQDEQVVVYDDGPGLAAARAWWLLGAHGVAVRLLDGGLRAWTSAGHRTEHGDTDVERGDVTLAPMAPVTIDVDQAAAFPATGTLVDSRAAERFRGDVEPIDPRAGHVPGAVNHPTTGNVGPDGRFLAPAAMRAGFAASGVDLDGPVAVYCGSGITAAHNVLALTIAGSGARAGAGAGAGAGADGPLLWPASWSGWSNDPDRPVATGA
jgi:thiosulfate/3-mercaptopyruvate sulfurtransferase